MAAASLEVRIAAPPDRVWGVLVDYPRYPEFVPGVRGCRVIPAPGGACHVEYDVDLGIRKIRYVLALREEKPRRLSWTLVEGELLTRSEGQWELTEIGGATLARYTVDVQITRPPLVPRFVVDRVVDELTRVQLPALVHAFKARAEGSA